MLGFLAAALPGPGCGLAAWLCLLLLPGPSKPGRPGCGLVQAACLPEGSGGAGAAR